jgi:hypothetical protein
VKVLIDYHHHDLWESLRLLFNKRLGWEILRPIGMDWFEQGYWNHERKWHGDAVARQYLEPWGDDRTLRGAPGTWRIDRSHPDGIYHLVTLEEARDIRPGLVISSLAHNHEGLHRFATEIGATFALQVGNVRFGPADMAEDRWDLAAFGLVSGFLPVKPPKPHVVYHQEFSLTDFAAVPPPRNDPLRVSSFVQCYPQDRPAYGWWQGTANRAPEFDWRCYGAYGDAPADQYQAGNIDRCPDVAKAMQASDIAWHAKRWSDGYGHVIHNWFAVGRPVFGFEEYYRSQMAGPLWIDGVTSIDIGRRSPEAIVAELRRLQDPEVHLSMCEAAAARFREVVNFDEEEQAIRAMLTQVLP